jgi:pyruvate dehydrogenase E1 component alpha subunit
LSGQTEEALAVGLPLRLLTPDGEYVARGEPPMAPGTILKGLRLMMLSRLVDDRAIKMQRLGRLGTYGPVHGQEASVVGSAMALDPARDWLVPAYREQPAMYHHGMPLARLLAVYMGKIDDGRVPDGVRMLPRQQSVAAQLPHAVGLAWAQKLQRTGGAVLVYLGEGAASEGDFHESCNLAGVLRAPVVFFLQNNGYAISTPGSFQTAADSLAVRAEGYGFVGVVVDGNDLFAVHEATTEAVVRARAGGGPTLIESRTYRMGIHNTTDDWRHYRSAVEVAEAAQLDPIQRVQRYLRARGLWDDSTAAELTDSIAAEVAGAFAAAEAFPKA